MKYFKYANVDPPLDKLTSTKLLDYTNSNSYTTNGFWTNIDTHDVLKKIPELIELYKPIGINIKRIAFITALDKIGDIHMDDPKTAPAIRINLPVLNCDNTSTNFFTSEKPPIEMQLPSGIYYYKWLEQDCKLVASTCIDKSTLIRTNELHQVCIHTDNMPRITCTIEFYENLEYLMN